MYSVECTHWQAQRTSSLCCLQQIPPCINISKLTTRCNLTKVEFKKKIEAGGAYPQIPLEDSPQAHYKKKPQLEV